MPENLEHYVSVYVTYMYTASRDINITVFNIHYTEENYYAFK